MAAAAARLPAQPPGLGLRLAAEDEAELVGVYLAATGAEYDADSEASLIEEAISTGEPAWATPPEW